MYQFVRNVLLRALHQGEATVSHRQIITHKRHNEIIIDMLMFISPQMCYLEPHTHTRIWSENGGRTMMWWWCGGPPNVQHQTQQNINIHKSETNFIKIKKNLIFSVFKWFNVVCACFIGFINGMCAAMVYDFGYLLPFFSFFWVSAIAICAFALAWWSLSLVVQFAINSNDFWNALFL